MDLVLRFSFEAQVIAAVVVFFFGYLALFGSLIICLLIARALYEGAKLVWFRAVKSVWAGRSQRRLFSLRTRLLSAAPRLSIIARTGTEKG